MNLKRMLTGVILLAGVGLATMSGARAEIVEGRDYTVLSSPKPTETGKNIEVIEFFWYGCPHCNELHPHLKAWQKRASKDVSFRYVPAVARASWVPGAKTFYTLDTLGLVNEMHDKVFDAIHDEKIDLGKEDILFDWIVKQGIDRKKFVDVYSSFAVQNQATRSAQMLKEYSLTGVPALVINGKYVTSGRMGSTPQENIRILESLIEKARKEKGM